MIPVIEFFKVSKSFGQCVANQSLCFRVLPGSIHAVIGENGAGKSTAMKMLYGVYPPDSGVIYLHGKPWGGALKPWTSPYQAIAKGIGMVHQHFMLSGSHTVLDNIILGGEPTHSSWRWCPQALRPVDREKAKNQLKKLAQKYGLEVPWEDRVEKLPVGIQQRIEILKLLYREAQILILDEPTAVLSQREIDDLFTQLKHLSRQGKTILMITHKLKEVMNLADRVTVLRAGTVVGEREVSTTDLADLARLMVGREVGLGQSLPEIVSVKEPVLELKAVSLMKKKLKEISFQVCRGEIVGIAGVEGNGQTELLELLFASSEIVSQMQGQVILLGNPLNFKNPHEIHRLGVGFVPEDRLRDALLLQQNVEDNYILGHHRCSLFSCYGWLKPTVIHEKTWEVMNEYDICPRSTSLSMHAFSGGHQQKLVMARALKSLDPSNAFPPCLVVAHPTRGVDLGAIEFIHHQLLKARAQGSGILLISSELEEILTLSDRILVMYEGKILKTFLRAEVTEQSLGLAIGGST